MGGFGLSTTSTGGHVEFEGRITWYVVLCGIIAATGGLMFGYDIGISGGVTSMDDFLEKFFQGVYVKKHEAKESNYCKFNNQGLQLFTSSLYLAAIIASFFASKACSKYGRKRTMQAASLFFLAGVALNAAAVSLPMLIIGRILLGFGVGFANQAVPLFLSEIAPVRIRGALNILFQLQITIGIFIANIVNYFTSKLHPWGWRLSLGIAGVPALILFLGSMLITETPTSLIERNEHEQGRQVLKKIRGTDNVNAEFEELVHASEIARQVKHPFRNLMKRNSRPQLIIAILMQVFQQFTGINAIMFYAPVLFQTMGFKNNASLLSAVITGLVNVLSTIVSVACVDKAGRRALLLEACGQMLIAQTIIGGILAATLHDNNTLGKGMAVGVVLLVCLFVSGFAWSWGPLGWLIPSETFPLETRTAGYAFAVSSNMLFTFLIAQAFLSMLCQMKSGIFFFFAGWIIIMALFVKFMLPETKGIPMEEMTERVWKNHWYWKRFMVEDECELSKMEKGISP
ncbi:sugar transport protein 8-like [Dioscorea cayenensis subsp. rotundata]|uniref:Sugar transport protein 8-like n=1 Tax=Dioscorea cayennensis subsp. rotundata TaxID=55577 RepID=A0AB40CR89_DIOCR|nr:sugar transport protein 8-like [Dioscorea cayenensis subsp. rotundata]